MTTEQGSGWRGHVEIGILDAAAEVLAANRGASMTEIAAAAGVARATLYRYFPTRQALLRQLAAVAIEETGTYLAEAGLDDVAVVEAFARLTRAMIAAGRKYIALAELPSEHIDQQAIERQVYAPLDALLTRGAAEGALRRDLAPPVLRASLIGLIRSMIILSLRDGLGVERASDAVTTLFLDGARPRRAAGSPE